MNLFKYLFLSYFAFNKRDIEIKDATEANKLVNYSGILILFSIPILNLNKKSSLLIVISTICSILADAIFFGAKTNKFNAIDRWTATIAYIIVTKYFFKHNVKLRLKILIYMIHSLVSGFFLYKSKMSLTTKQYNKYHGLWHFYGIGIGNIILYLFKDL